jgi:hypothetical protein
MDMREWHIRGTPAREVVASTRVMLSAVSPRAHVSSSGRMRASGVFEGTMTVLLYGRLQRSERWWRLAQLSKLIASYPRSMDKSL